MNKETTEHDLDQQPHCLNIVCHMVAATCSVRTLSRLPHAPCPCHLAAPLFHPPCSSLTAHASLTPHVFSQKPSRSTPGDRRGLSSGSRLQVPLTAVHLSDGRSWPAMGIRPAARRVAGCASPAPRAPTRVPVWQKPAGGSRARAPMPARTPSAAAAGLPSPSERAPATCGERALSSGWCCRRACTGECRLTSGRAAVRTGQEECHS